MSRLGRQLDTVRQRTLPDPIPPEYGAPAEGMPPIPPPIPPACGACKVVEEIGGGVYRVTQTFPTVAGGWEDADGKNGFTNLEATEVNGVEDVEVGAQGFFVLTPHGAGEPARRVVVYLDPSLIAEGVFYECMITGVHTCGSIVFNSRGEYVGAYDNATNWVGCADHAEPSSVTQIDIP